MWLLRFGVVFITMLGDLGGCQGVAMRLLRFCVISITMLGDLFGC